MKRPPESIVEWKRWGKDDPLWGVAAWPGKQKGGAAPWTDEEFAQLGASDWADCESRWRRYGVDARSCLEIGCGAGRLTAGIGRFFAETLAVDVSEGMIAYAQQHVRNPSVTFLQSNGTRLPVGDSSVSSVFSTHVFQHFDSLEYAAFCFGEVSRALRPGGSAMIHVPIYRWHPGTPRVAKAIFHIRNWAGHVSISIGRQFIKLGLRRPVMSMLYFPIDWLFETLPSYGLTDIELVAFPVRSSGLIHPFVFARKL